jgi:hypothetical protein
METTNKRDTTYMIETPPPEIPPEDDSPSGNAPEKLFPHNPESVFSLYILLTHTTLEILYCVVYANTTADLHRRKKSSTMRQKSSSHGEPTSTVQTHHSP